MRASGLALGLVAVVSAAAGPKPYVDAGACARDGHGLAECARAAAQARAAFDAEAPHFARRDLCEQRFARCMIGHVFAHGGADFTPATRGFVLSRGGGRPVWESALAQAAPPRASEPPAPVEGQPVEGPPGSYPAPKALVEEMRARARRYGAQ